MKKPMSRLTALIIDDEQHAIDLMKNVLQLFDNNIQIVGEAQNLPEGLKQIQAKKPDVVFLDINMPVYSGLQIKDFVDGDRDFEIVFVTAHEQHTIEALRMAAFDYLLKPIDLSGLQACLDRLNHHFERKRSKSLELEQKQASSFNPVDRKIAINTQSGTHYLALEDILFLEASSMYTVIHTIKEQILVSKPLKEFDYLEDQKFYRTHRSFMVNTSKVVKFSSAEGLEVILTNKAPIPVSRGKKDAFKRFMALQYGIV